MMVVKSENIFTTSLYMDGVRSITPFFSTATLFPQSFDSSLLTRTALVITPAGTAVKRKVPVDPSSAISSFEVIAA